MAKPLKMGKRAESGEMMDGAGCKAASGCRICLLKPFAFGQVVCNSLHHHPALTSLKWFVVVAFQLLCDAAIWLSC